MFERIFFTEDSPKGQEKTKLLTDHKAVCLNQFNVPPFRLSWESAQAIITEQKQMILEQMRACRQDAQLAGEFEKVDGHSPDEIFFTLFAQYTLPALFPGFNPEFGFDTDVFLVADDETKLVYHIELFPRSEKGKRAKAYGSTLKFVVPFATKRERGPFDDLGAILFVHTGATRGETFLAAGARWASLRCGQWKLADPEEVSMFVHCAAFSHIEHYSPESKDMINAGFVRGIDDGVNQRAVLEVGHSK